MTGDIHVPLRFRPAYDRQLARIIAVPLDALRPVNIDVPTAATLVLGVVRKVAAFRARLAALPEFDLALVDALEDLAMATLHAHAAWASASVASVPIAGLVEEAILLREQLLADARSLVLRKMIDPSSLEKIKGGAGYRNAGMDLLELASALNAVWPRISGRTAVTEADLTRAESLGAEIMLAVGQREHAEAEAADVGTTRARAFTLLVRAYDELRRGIGYLRTTQGDVDTLFPSLFAGKKAAKAKEELQALPQTVSVSPAPEDTATPPVSVDGPFR